MSFLYGWIIILLIIPCISTFSQHKFWEDLSDEKQKAILQDTTTFMRAAEYYSDSFKPSDDSNTFELLDTLTKKRVFNPLYFELFNRILSSSDGALSEVLREYCTLMVYSFPGELIYYFTLNNNTSGKLQQLYSSFVGGNLTLKEFTKLKIYIEGLFISNSQEHEVMKEFLIQIHSYINK